METRPFLDLPVVGEHSKTPCLTAAQVESMLADAKYKWERRLYLVLASTGLRISEVLALEWCHLLNDGRTLIVEQKVDRFGKIVRSMKTKSGKREIDFEFFRGGSELLRKGTPLREIIRPDVQHAERHTAPLE